MSNNNTIYKVTVAELDSADDELSMPIYEQVVEELDIKAVIEAVNKTPAKPTKRTRAPRSDKGMKRSGEAVIAEQ